MRNRRGPHKLSTVAELEAAGVKIVKWDGRYATRSPASLSPTILHRCPLVIVDKDQRIVGVFVGKPADPQWDSEVIPGACRAMERASREAKATDARASAPHRRGKFTAISSGVSFGGGQKVPGNLVHPKWRQRLIARLLKNKYIRRIAGFQSSAFAYWAPKVYKEYADTLQQLFTEYPGLEHNFRNSIFPAVTFNCSPDSVSLSHVDFNNNPAGWCAITSGGRFDHTSGAHLHMSPFKVAVEFPSGSTSLILSGAIEHGNTPILDGETRFSMTQYAAGGLFRWVKYGFKSAKALLAMKGGKQIRAAYDGEAGSRWEQALNLFSTLDGIDCDRQNVFSQASVKA
ncbi:hypothetical protein B0H15DRAFT_771439 [Mycena belliarum]|uniref:Uncharacterized protein n=1 Tax=Mycena belliarum TaxID=1033014 RepID=A0AAD6XVN0_9AGAR|nr:hypothetical protein B0H15DRAFT_771439 [Mycena belliae]